MPDDATDVSKHQAGYYGSLFERHGPSVDAVASGQQVYKDLRYQKLSAVFQDDDDFTVHDVGFGLGHYYEYLKARFPNKRFTYSGSEITPQFVEHCRQAYPECSFDDRDLAAAPFAEPYDYLIFGGTFYHLEGVDHDTFTAFVRAMLANGFRSARRGIAFNLVTGFVDYRYDSLYYGDLADLLPFVVNNLSRFFTVDHSTPLYEYTVCVYHEAYVAAQNPGEAFRKYYKGSA